MHMKLFDFKCTGCSEVFEEFATDHEATTMCKKCKSVAHTIVSAVRIGLDGTDPGFPRAWEQWSKKRDQKAKQEAKYNES